MELRTGEDRAQVETMHTVAGRHVKKSIKKPAKKTAKQAGRNKDHAAEQQGLRAAFHHMQRAAVVISLMEKGTGEDLRDLMERGVKQYEGALAGKGGADAILRAVGLLRATEHLAMAGLYEARRKHRQKVEAPDPAWLVEFVHAARERLARAAEMERSDGPDLLPVSEELLLQAEEHKDPHIAYELVMAADALCLALEHGL